MINHNRNDRQKRDGVSLKNPEPRLPSPKFTETVLLKEDRHQVRLQVSVRGTFLTAYVTLNGIFATFSVAVRNGVGM